MDYPLIMSGAALVFAMYQFFSNRLKSAEDKLNAAQLAGFKDSIVRVNSRLDDSFEGQADITHQLNGKDGFHARMATLEAL